MAITKKCGGEWVDHEWVRWPEERLVTTHEGHVLEVYNRDYRAMSDVYTLATFATVLNAKGEIEEVLVNANFECDQSQGRAIVDATHEVKEAYKQMIEAIERRREEFRQAEIARHAAEQARKPVVGRVMVVSRGRKVPKGTRGVVAALWDGGARALLKPEGTTAEGLKDRKVAGVWVDSRNLEPA